MELTNAIEIKDLYKDFGDVQAVRGVSLEIEAGSVFSLLGPNGAGKSTTISVISGLLRPTKGDAEVLGYSITKSPLKAKSNIGVVPQDIALYEDLTARENLTFWGSMYGLRGTELSQRVDDILELTELTERQKDKVEKYSGGMKRRLNIGVALLHKPRIVIMDEPTVGIDPQSRRKILDSVKALNREGMTVLYTTHYMEEAQELSDKIAIMDQGKVIAQGAHEELVRIVGELDRIELAFSTSIEQQIDSWASLPGVKSITPDTDKATLLAEDSDQVLPYLFEAAAKDHLRITSVTVHEPNLETVFLHLTGRALRE
ncbi:MAG TPA: ATP-binding cassette domain-containing protein [Anaerolineales bacterium]|jgi:ABC-2 type transport system ATP-binding protein|nr:ATP-binding cassette domain-containing protein [Anaerolineales bacterium]